MRYNTATLDDSTYLGDAPDNGVQYNAQDAISHLQEKYGGLPDYDTAMKQFAKYDLFSNIPSEKVDGPVKHVAEKRDYSRRTVQRIQEGDEGLAELLRQSDINYKGELEEPQLGEDILKYHENKETIDSIMETPDFEESYKNLFVNYDFFSDPYIMNLDSRINHDLTPEQALGMKRDYANQFKETLKRSTLDNYLKQLPYESQLLYAASESISNSDSYKEAKEKFERSYIGLLAEAYQGDVSQMAEAAGKSERTIRDKLKDYEIHTAELQTPEDFTPQPEDLEAKMAEGEQMEEGLPTRFSLV